MAHRALGDVRHRQIGNDPAAEREAQDLVVGTRARAEVGVGELDTLRRAGRAGGVDQGENVVGSNRPPGGVEIEAGRRALDDVVEGQTTFGSGIVDHDDVLHCRQLAHRRADPVEEGALADDHGRLGVGHLVGDLIRRRRVVDRVRGRAQVHRRGIDDVELGAVAEHQSDRSSALEPESRQTGRDLAHPLRVLAPRIDGLAAPGAKRGRFTHLLDSDLERLAGGLGVESRRPLRRPFSTRLDSHCSPPPPKPSQATLTHCQESVDRDLPGKRGEC
ncbi:hypothetical protein HRbin41_01272 [bacterium HR41]|nr:hypothetical protein HRbin41_01272 [bacterium HR41]